MYDLEEVKRSIHRDAVNNLMATWMDCVCPEGFHCEVCEAKEGNMCVQCSDFIKGLDGKKK
jgi:hypothetical protein